MPRGETRKTCEVFTSKLTTELACIGVQDVTDRTLLVAATQELAGMELMGGLETLQAFGPEGMIGRTANGLFETNNVNGYQLSRRVRKFARDDLPCPRKYAGTSGDVWQRAVPLAPNSGMSSSMSEPMVNWRWASQARGRSSSIRNLPPSAWCIWKSIRRHVALSTSAVCSVPSGLSPNTR